MIHLDCLFHLDYLLIKIVKMIHLDYLFHLDYLLIKIVKMIHLEQTSLLNVIF